MKEIEGSKWNFNKQRVPWGRVKKTRLLLPLLTHESVVLSESIFKILLMHTLKMMKNLCVLNLNFVNFLVLITLN